MIRTYQLKTEIYIDIVFYTSEHNHDCELSHDKAWQINALSGIRR